MVWIGWLWSRPKQKGKAHEEREKEKKETSLMLTLLVAVNKFQPKKKKFFFLFSSSSCLRFFLSFFFRFAVLGTVLWLWHRHGKAQQRKRENVCEAAVLLFHFIWSRCLCRSSRRWFGGLNRELLLLVSELFFFLWIVRCFDEFSNSSHRRNSHARIEFEVVQEFFSWILWCFFQSQFYQMGDVIYSNPAEMSNLQKFLSNIFFSFFPSSSSVVSKLKSKTHKMLYFLFSYSNLVTFFFRCCLAGFIFALLSFCVVFITLKNASKLWKAENFSRIA